jgi:hypothetical protein
MTDIYNFSDAEALEFIRGRMTEFRDWCREQLRSGRFKAAKRTEAMPVAKVSYGNLCFFAEYKLYAKLSSDSEKINIQDCWESAGISDEFLKWIEICHKDEYDEILYWVPESLRFEETLEKEKASRLHPHWEDRYLISRAIDDISQK